jgi:glycyl-tRNA synthetase beta chain
MADFLFEVGTEEMPATFVEPALRQLRERLTAALEEARLACAPPERWRAYGTPRRIALYVPGIQACQDDVVRDVRGPAAAAAFDADGRPTKAAAGFAKSQGVAPESLVRRRVEDKEYVFASVAVPGQPARIVLSQALPRVLAALSFPKTMRWGGGDTRFGRPVRWILALLDGEVVPVAFGGVVSGDVTYGHRLLGPGPHAVARPDLYEPTLTENGHVIPGAEARRDVIRDQVTRAAEAVGGRARIVEALLEEVTYLVETPRAFAGTFDSLHLALPFEILTTVMAHHQRYFPVESNDGDLRPNFIAVRNGGDEGLDGVREGNEWVLSARLADARFFYEEDRRGRLEHRLSKLADLVFQRNLGTMIQKTERLVRLSAWLAEVTGAGERDAADLARAARLCKADLATSVVSELPELQGVMGALYAAADGEPAGATDAIRGHYQPRGASDAVAATVPGALLAVADRADTLTGCLAAGYAPTGSADPFGLRRAASGFFETVVAHGLSIPLRDLVEAALAGYRAQAIDAASSDGARGAALEFLRARLRAWLIEREEEAGRRNPRDGVDAVLAAGSDDALDAVRRLEALQIFRSTAAFPAAYAAFDRASRIAAPDGPETWEDARLAHDTERGLALALREIAPRVRELSRHARYLDALHATSALAAPVAALFDAVLVNDPDPDVRGTRHALLRGVVACVRGIADFAQLQVTGNEPPVG